MQFTNSSLEKLAKNLSKNDFECLIQEFGSENLQLLKQKDAYPYKYMNGLKDFLRKNYLMKVFYSYLKDVHTTDKEYLTCIQIWSKFSLKNMVDYHDHYLEKGVLLLAGVFEKFINTCLRFCKFSWIKLSCKVKNDWNKIGTNFKHT